MQLRQTERYDFAGQTRSATREYPAAVDALHVKYPDYDFVWDRQKDRWLCVRRLGPEKIVPIFFLEDDETGVPYEPSPGFTALLDETDFRRKADTIEKYLDMMERERDAWERREQERVDEEEEYMTRDFLDYIRSNPASFTSSALPGWTPTHVYRVANSLKLSARSQQKEEPLR